MHPFVIELSETDPLRIFSAVHHLPYALLLDSADHKHPAARYSYILHNPIKVVETEGGGAGNGTKVSSLKGEERFTGDPFAVLEARLATFTDNAQTLPDLPPFQGGAAGLFGYDLGRALESLPDTARQNLDMPDMAVGIYDQVIAFDHKLDKAWIITHATDETEAAIKQRTILRALENAAMPAPFSPLSLDWTSSFEADEYIQAIERVIKYIHAGDIFQANIAQRFTADLPANFNAFTHYCRLRKMNAAPFASYFNLGDIKISSASPERFLTMQDGAVETRPIKGTRPHAHNEMMDKTYREELLSSEKDRAENVMIVDLMRNDLSKICTPESVGVTGLCELESFASVHHLVSTVRGRLQEGKSAIDLLRACFPGGSITGAPKIRAMEIIEKMEGQRRGPYTGSIGYIGFNGTMDSSILIRTLVYQGDSVSLHAGSGIVADSNADSEYQETFDKADAMFRSFEDLAYEIEEDYLAAMAGFAAE